MTLGAGRSLSFSADGASLGHWGRLKWGSGGQLEIVNSLGGRRVLDMLPEAPAGTVGWIDEANGILALAGERSSVLSVVNLSFDELVETIALERDPDVGLRSMTFFPVEGGALCCLTEAELFALEGTGKLKWRLFHNDLTLTLLEVDGQAIRLESLLPDLDDSSRHTIVIDARTGTEKMSD